MSEFWRGFKDGWQLAGALFVVPAMAFWTVGHLFVFRTGLDRAYLLLDIMRDLRRKP
jgi:hypothetical protein